MSEISKKAFISILKWTWVIIVATVAYNYIAPNYYFMRQRGDLYRGNKVTGSIEYLDSESGDNEWVDITESVMTRVRRTERKKQQVAGAKKVYKGITKVRDLPDDDDLDFLDEPEKETSESRFSS